MRESHFQHVPVMLAEALDGLAVKAGGRYLDGTFGRGGHARAVLERLGADGKLLLMDRDPEAIAVAQRDFGTDPRVSVRHANFAELGRWDEVSAGVDGILLDIGVSSPQLDDAERGFSFMADAPLDMRMDPTCGQSAADFLAVAEEAVIADVLWRFGEERRSRAIARAIVEQRGDHPLTRTTELAALVANVLGHRERGKHPATRTFQALRIHVNSELDSLERVLHVALQCLNPGGRLVVISFHSLEDRIVKQFLRDESGYVPATPRHLPPVHAKPARLRIIAKAKAGAAELAINPRARSAVLRVAECLETAS